MTFIAGVEPKKLNGILMSLKSCLNTYVQSKKVEEKLESLGMPPLKKP
jgi:hypothetical protein